MAKKRTKVDIINEMLLAIMQKGGEIKPTHLMYKANLSYSLMNTYLDELIEKEMVRRQPKKHNTYLLITDKGYHFVEKFRQMKEFERAFGLD